MKAALHANDSEHQQAARLAMQAGLRRHGIKTEFAPFDQPVACDFAVVWGARQKRVFAAGRPVLVMERGHIADRFAYTSIGWDAIGRRGRYPVSTDRGARWVSDFAELMQPWTRRDHGYALIMGQVDGDEAVRKIDVNRWASAVAAGLDHCWEVRF